MDLSGIISISGKAGLYRVIAQGKNSIIVEALDNNKRFPAYASDRISALEDISIYTYEDDKPLKEIFEGMMKKAEGKACPGHKEDMSVLQEFLLDVLPNYDEERVYPSDIKKLFQWYNLLHKAGVIKAEEKKPVKKESAKEAKAEKGAEKKTTKKAPAKKAAPKKTEASATKEKKPAAKKSPAKKKTDK